jgi:hypothetical protein
MTMYGTAPAWHAAWILPTAATVIFLALVFAGVVLAAWYLTSPPPGSGADPQPLDFPAAPRKCSRNATLAGRLTTMNTSGVSRRCAKMVERHAF